ncbi:DUF2752 domain-containing protein [Cellulomonas soli]|uniref:DUF2752 domain-containing protein n=1 Tax=Cellulomonas soli TaxID=931535 RepID=UPI003F83CB6D
MAAVAAGLTAVVVWRDPHVGGSLGFCPLRVLTGWACPACGALRATDDLVHGDLAGAWAHNPLWVALTPLLVVMWVRWVARRRAGSPARPLSPRWGIGGLAVLLVFAVARNLPAWQPFLGP